MISFTNDVDIFNDNTHQKGSAIGNGNPVGFPVFVEPIPDTSFILVGG